MMSVLMCDHVLLFHLQPKKKKNISHDAFGTRFGRLHMQKQNLDKLQTRKMKGLRKRRGEETPETPEAKTPRTDEWHGTRAWTQSQLKILEKQGWMEDFKHVFILFYQMCVCVMSGCVEQLITGNRLQMWWEWRDVCPDRDTAVHLLLDVLTVFGSTNPNQFDN